MMPALSRMFPPPPYITMPSVGVDISDTSLKYVEFKPTLRSGVERELLQWGSIDIPNGVVNRGEVQDAPKLVAILKELKNKTKAEFIRVSLPEEKAYLFETEIKKNTQMKEVRSLLEFRLEENVPIPSRDVFFDYSILPIVPEARSARVSVVAYAKDTIQNYYDSCVTAGLHPISFEVEAQAMSRAHV